MSRILIEARRFARDRSGAVTVDWVALTAAVVVIAIGLSYAILQGDGENGGLAGLTDTLLGKLNDVNTAVQSTQVPGGTE